MTNTTTKISVPSEVIGEEVRKRSKKPFKSGNTINTVFGVTVNPHSNRVAFTFYEDDSVVDVHQCRTLPSEDIKTFPRYMKGTTAIHQAGNISREEEDYCYITEQNDEGYVGHWVEGYGFVNVLFPYDTTRELTPEEQEFVDTHTVAIV